MNIISVRKEFSTLQKVVYHEMPILWLKFNDVGGKGDNLCVNSRTGACFQDKKDKKNKTKSNKPTTGADPPTDEEIMGQIDQ